jgi:hypothetical protein
MAEYVLEEVEFEAHRVACLKQFKIQLLRSSTSKQKHEINSCSPLPVINSRRRLARSLSDEGQGRTPARSWSDTTWKT